MSLLYLEKIAAPIRAAFGKKVEAVAAFVGIQPDWLMQVMWAESRLKPTAANRQGADKHLVAAGLLQFTLGSGIVKAGIVPSLAHILTLPALAQLDLVKWYFTPYRGKLKSYFDVYAVTFFPALIGKPLQWVLQTKTLSGSVIAKQNPAISKGKELITVADFKRYTVEQVPKSLRERVFGAIEDAVDAAKGEALQIKEAIVSHSKDSPGIGAGILIGLCMIGLFFLRKG